MLGNANISLLAGCAQYTDLYCKLNGKFFMIFTFSDPTVEPVKSGAVAVQLGPPHHLALLQTALKMVAGQPARVQPIVAVVDANDNVVPISGIRIAVSWRRARAVNYTLTRPSPKLAVFSAEGALWYSADTGSVGPFPQGLQETSTSGIARWTNLGIAAASSETDLLLLFELDTYPQQIWNGSNLTLPPVKTALFNVTDPRGTARLVLTRAPAIDWSAFGGEILSLQPYITCADINGVHLDSDESTRINVSIVESLPCCGILGGKTPSNILALAHFSIWVCVSSLTCLEFLQLASFTRPAWADLAPLLLSKAFLP